CHRATTRRTAIATGSSRSATTPASSPRLTRSLRPAITRSRSGWLIRRSSWRRASSTPVMHRSVRVTSGLRRASEATSGAMKFNHIGIPTTTRFEGEIDLPHLKVTVSDHQSNPFGIQWMRYWEDAPYPDLVKTARHVASEVEH